MIKGNMSSPFVADPTVMIGVLVWCATGQPAPRMKPLALVEQAIRNSSKSRDIVLDRLVARDRPCF